ncbi:MAG: hypothetical protein JW736_08660 [Deltaproteobacteria bacterium]|nr:hypothetical protein [Deltaproteobacteria bacterium]MBN2687861.1 hypothetical protein [Deltaproteobacteria bacterium]
MSQVSASQIAVSALAALDRKRDVTANNIANVNTDDFKKSRALFQTEDIPGVSVKVEKVDTPGMPQPNGVESSNVKIEKELASLITTEHSYTANVEVIETAGKMHETLIDIFA